MYTGNISWRRHRRLPFADYVGALLLVSISTVAGLLVSAHWGNSPVVLLYLPPVLAAAILAGLRPGLLAALASALSYNYFFTAPLHTFFIHSGADIVTVAVLFLVAAVTSHLAASVRAQARLASDHANRNATIAGFARLLMTCHGEREVAGATAVQLAKLLGCRVIVLNGRSEQVPLAAAPDPVSLDPGDLAAAAFTMQTGERAGRGVKRGNQADWQFHPVASGDAVIAAVGLAREDGTPPIDERQALLLGSLLDQMALALERARLDREAREAGEAKARERLRAAFLASIGDEVKPRLRTIQAGVRALRREAAADRSLVASLDSEVTRIDRFIDNLVELTPQGDGEALVVGELSLDLHRRIVLRGDDPVHLTPKEFAVLAELAKHAGRVLTHAQILRAVWGPAHQDHVDYLRVAVRALRQKLESDPSQPKLIVNEPGVGYRLVLS